MREREGETGGRETGETANFGEESRAEMGDETRNKRLSFNEVEEEEVKVEEEEEEETSVEESDNDVYSVRENSVSKISSKRDRKVEMRSTCLLDASTILRI